MIEANAMIQMQKYVYQMSDVKVSIHEDNNIHIVLFFLRKSNHAKNLKIANKTMHTHTELNKNKKAFS